MQGVIEADGVAKRWGEVQALRDVTVAVEDRITGLLGANGAGKTTFLGLVLGLHSPDAGRLRVLGADPAVAGPEVRARLGYAPEHDALPPQSRAQDLVRHVAELHGLPPRAAVSRAAETLDLVGLGEERLREIGTMSQGQRQRVKIAQAIAHDPALVLLDEPTNGLDPLQREDMLTTIRRIGHDLGIPVVVSSHLIHEVERVCDAVIVLDGGTVSASGDVAGMVRPGDEVVIEVDGDAVRLREVLTEAGLAPVALDPARLAVPVADEVALDVIRDAVVDLGYGLHRLMRRTATLQERFFAADATPPPPPPASPPPAATGPPPPPPGAGR